MNKGGKTWHRLLLLMMYVVLVIGCGELCVGAGASQCCHFPKHNFKILMDGGIGGLAS